MKITKYRAIISGDVIELFEYSQPLGYDFTYSRPPNSSRTIEKPEEVIEDSKVRSIRRTKQTLKRLIQANAGQWADPAGEVFTPKFVTLTFKENLQELTTANVIFTNFIKRFNYYFDNKKKNYFKYVSVPEFQKRGAVHFHTVFFNLHWFEKETLAEIWGHGFIKIKDADNFSNLGPYMTKYLTKDSVDDRLVGQKRYFPSRNLKRPVTIREHIIAEGIFSLTKDLEASYESTFSSDHYGEVRYRCLNLSSAPADVIGYIKSLTS